MFGVKLTRQNPFLVSGAGHGIAVLCQPKTDFSPLGQAIVTAVLRQPKTDYSPPGWSSPGCKKVVVVLTHENPRATVPVSFCFLPSIRDIADSFRISQKSLRSVTPPFCHWRQRFWVSACSYFSATQSSVNACTPDTIADLGIQ
jgi:hypothetical protein